MPKFYAMDETFAPTISTTLGDVKQCTLNSAFGSMLSFKKWPNDFPQVVPHPTDMRVGISTGSAPPDGDEGRRARWRRPPEAMSYHYRSCFLLVAQKERSKLGTL